MIQIKRQIMFNILFGLVILMVITIPGNTKLVSTQTKISPPHFSYPILISTRGHFDNNTGELLANHTTTDYNATNVPGLEVGQCPPELVIFVHGSWVDGSKTGFESASEIFNRTKISLEKNNYNNPLAGFSWDSNTTIRQTKTNGWIALKLIAKENGPKLAQFLLDFMNKCANQGSKVRIIAHSLGARVVLSALETLNNNQQWNSKHFKIASVHLLAAAVDDEEVSTNPFYIVKNPPLDTSSILKPPVNLSVLKDLKESYDVYGIKSAYGTAIENVVEKFFNLYSSKDALLILLYPPAELDNPLGLRGAQAGISLPSNYNEKNVTNMIPPFCDANGDNMADKPFQFNMTYARGENHAGYYGFRNATANTTLIDDGAINTVVRDWNSTLAPEKQISTLPEQAKCMLH
jgi:pimeloyl-ACP methyl ester carboxylesterase